LALNLGAEIRISPELSIEETYRGLMQLEYLAKRHPENLPADVELYILGNSYKRVHEHSLRIALALDVLMDWSDWVDRLRADKSASEARIGAVQEGRRKLKEVEALPGIMSGFDVRCLPAGSLTSASCLSATERFMEYLKSRPGFAPPVKRVMIASQDRARTPVESSADTSYVIVLREDFTPGLVDQIALHKGWLK
ncbi:MAG: hypothetical protein HC902_01930, partial [Calothrix sp. SM1_5_4]|nr:hypothetical protein [Calothrix sp. SM1_5_4]